MSLYIHFRLGKHHEIFAHEVCKRPYRLWFGVIKCKELSFTISHSLTTRLQWSWRNGFYFYFEKYATKNIQVKENSKHTIASRQTINMLCFHSLQNKKEGSRKEIRGIWQMKIHDANQKKTQQHLSFVKEPEIAAINLWCGVKFPLITLQ